MNIEYYKSLDYTEIKSIYKAYLEQQPLSSNTVSTMSADCFYIWNNGSKELFWSVVTSPEFESIAPVELKKALTAHSSGNVDNLVNGYVSQIRRFKLFIENSCAAKSSAVDFIAVLNYLAGHRELTYEAPETEGLSNDEVLHYQSIKDAGENAVAEMKKMAELCGQSYSLTSCSAISWLDGSKTKTKKYLCAQMQYKDYEDKPVCISIYVEYTDEKKAYYRISLDVKGDAFNKSELKQFHKHLNLSNNGLIYVQGSGAWGVPEVVDEPQEVIKEKVENGKYRKVQLCGYIENIPAADNNYYEYELLNIIGKLIPYYEQSIGLDDYWPSLEEYNPGITEEEWLLLLNNPKVFDVNSLQVMAAFYDYGGEATCAQLSEKHGKSYIFYRNVAISLGKRVINEAHCPQLPEKEENSRYWPVLFFGKKADKEKHGNYKWKLRDELKAALGEFDIARYLHPEENKVKYDKNMILYGPPGTGKTYNTAIYAVAICDNKKMNESADYDEVMKRFNELKSEGRIAFTTFHQSYGYEEFIEGIKPIADGTSDSLSYRVEAGVFKRFCDKARLSDDVFPMTGEIWSVRNRATDEDVQFDLNQYMHENGVVLVEDIEDSNRQCDLLTKMNYGDIVVLGRTENIDAIGIVEDYEPQVVEKAPFHYQRKAKWLAWDIKKKFKDIGRPEMCLSNFAIAKSKLTVNDISALLQYDKTGNSPCVFIIDEINRGNISKIFGELITLIEDTKRDGMPEAASAILPYSGEQFSVPDNVYLLGTMNTADRSIALMDTALRRRFRFIEQMPDETLLSGVTVNGVNIETMLRKINERISILYDREHTIGHAFFMKLKQEPTLDNLKTIFQKSVVPLLQEYFYEDWQKIQLVLGDNAKAEDKYKFIIDEKVTLKNVFKGNVDEVIDIEKKYSVNAEAFNHIESYEQII